MHSSRDAIIHLIVTISINSKHIYYTCKQSCHNQCSAHLFHHYFLIRYLTVVIRKYLIQSNSQLLTYLAPLSDVIV